MKNAKEMQLDKMLDCLRSAGLTPEQLAQTEDYIVGDGECPNFGLVNKLDAKVRVNSAQQREVENYLQKLINSKRMEEFGKLVNLLFQVYGVSMRCMFPRYLFGTYSSKLELDKNVSTAQLVALMAEMRTRDVYRINTQSINEVINMAKSPVVVKMAYELADKQYCNGRILLLAAYFKMQKNTFSGITDIADKDSGSAVKKLVAQMNKAFEPTPKPSNAVGQNAGGNVNPGVWQNTPQHLPNNPGMQLSSQPAQVSVSGILGGLAKLFGKKKTPYMQQAVQVIQQQPQVIQQMQDAVQQQINLQQANQQQPSQQISQPVQQQVTQSPNLTKKKTLSPEDKALFDEYVHLIITNIRSIFEGNIPNSDVARIIEYINNDETTKTPRPKEICDIVNRYKINEYFDALFLGCAVANYKMSYKLTNLIKVCACGNNFNRTMDLVRDNRVGEEITKHIDEWREDFMLDTTELICWCAKIGLKSALPKLAQENSDEYITALKKVDLSSYSKMIEALNDIDPRINAEKFKAIVADSGDDKRRMIAGELTKAIEGRLKAEDVEDIKSYLINGGDINIIYALSDQLKGVSSYYNNSSYANSLKNYHNAYGSDDFYKRCRAYIAIKLVAEDGSYYIFSNNLTRNNGNYSKDEIKVIFREFDEVRVHLDTQVAVAMGIYDNAYLDSFKSSLMDAYVDIFNTYLHLREEEMLKAFSEANANGRYLGVYVIGVNKGQYKDVLFAYFADGSKLVKEELANAISANEEWLPDVVERLKSKKAADRELAATILAKSKGDYTEELKAALEVEKSKKTADVIRGLLGATLIDGEPGADGASGATLTTDALVKELHKCNRKRSLAWAYEAPYPEVHFTGDNAEAVADEAYMQAILLGYNDMTAPKYNKRIETLTNKLNKSELALYMNELYDRWIEAGAEAKKKWVLYVTAIYGGADMVVKLQRQINDWAGNSRGAIAAEAVKSMALNDSPTALLVVDGIARKYKYKQVKAAAGDALTFAAEELGLTREELADRIVPDLGFNENLERIFDYGERQFKVYITPALEIEIFDENDKKLKNMPAPGKKDDEAKAAEAYAEFKQMKKQMKTTVTNQKLRLEYALTVNRRWKAADWEKLFVKNPIMHQFAISLIWGVYENEELKDTFRYMEDGTFNTVDEDEYEISESAIIGLVHPVELDEETKSKWQEQLTDYEITQSIEQLSRPVYRITDSEKKEKALTKVAGKMLNPLSLSSKLIGLGWTKGPAMDGGGFYKYVRDDADCKMGVELYFSGAFIGDYASINEDDVTVYDAVIYNTETVQYDRKGWGDVAKESALDLGDVPARYYSEIVYQLEKATTTSTETNENWRNEK